MLSFIFKRAGTMVAVLLVLAAAVFLLQRYTPADPVRVKLGPNAPASIVARERHKLGYDQPVPTQFVHYLDNLLHGDLGVSLRTQRPVAKDIGDFLPATLELVTGIVIAAALLGVALALLTSRDARGSSTTRFSMAAGAAAPPFLLVLLGLLFFYRQLGWLPASGRTSFYDAPTGPTGFLTVDSLIAGRLDVFVDALRHLVLPVVCGAIAPGVAIARVLRSSLMNTLRSDHARTARAKGLKERTVVWRHAMRNSLGPALSLAGLLLASLFTGTLVVEQIVSWPGLGAYTVRSIEATDFPAIAGVTLVLGGLTVVINAIVEVLQSVADPRIRL